MVSSTKQIESALDFKLEREGHFMKIKSVEIKRANIKKINMQLSQNAASGAQKAQFQLVFKNGKKTDWQDVGRSSIERGKLTGNVKDWGLEGEEMKEIVQKARSMFRDNDKHGGITLEGSKCSVEDMLEDLMDILREIPNNAEVPEIINKGSEIWIRTKDFASVANRMKEMTGYGRYQILSFLKYEDCLRHTPSRTYDFQVSNSKAEETKDRKPRYYVIKMDAVQKVIKGEKTEPETDIEAGDMQADVDIQEDEGIYTTEISSVPRWGSKKAMVDEIKCLIPEHDTYMELYGGSAAVLLNHSKSRREILNDKDPEMFVLYEVCKNREQSKEFLEKIEKIKYDKTVFEKARKAKAGGYMGMSKVEKAINVFILLTQSYNACMKEYSNKNTTDYPMNYYFRFQDVIKRLKDVEIYNSDAMRFIRQEKNNKQVFMLLDPPYLHALRAAKNVYDVEMYEKEQIEMLEEIKDSECKIMLCGYRAQEGDNLYDKILRTSQKGKWHCHLLKTVAKPGIKDRQAEEYIWVNYELPEGWKHNINSHNYMEGEK